jgi:hypothetical protein
MLPLFFFDIEKLLNRYHTLHAEGKVRGAVERVRARGDVRERDRDRFSGVRQQGARELTHLGGDVGIELRLCCWRNGCGIEGNVVWSAADYRELDAVAGFDRDVGGVELISRCVADHLDFVGCSGDRGRCGSASRRGSACRSRSWGSCSCRSSRIDLDRARVSSTLVAAGACAEYYSARGERDCVEPHFSRGLQCRTSTSGFEINREGPREIVNLFTNTGEINANAKTCNMNHAAPAFSKLLLHSFS